MALLVVVLILILMCRDNESTVLDECEWTSGRPVAGLLKRDMTTKLFLTRYPEGVPKHFLELRTYRDTLSLELQRRGYLEDCLTLHKISQEIDGDGIFVDVGANIGACAIVIAASGMSTLAFEPMPSNLQYLTRSVLINRNRPEIDSNFTNLRVFAAALGATSKYTTMHSQADNFGNSMLGTFVQDSDSRLPRREASIKSTVRVLTYDEAVESLPCNSTRVALMKIDVQGAESSVLLGMNRTYASNPACLPRFIFTEIDPVRLKVANSSVYHLLGLLRAYGYVPNPLKGVPGVTAELSWNKLAADLEEESKAKGTNAATNFLARLDEATSPIHL